MKRVKSIKGTAIFISILMLFSVTACSNKNADENQQQSQQQNQEEQQVNTTDAKQPEEDAQVADLGTFTIINMGNEPEFDMDEYYYPLLDELTSKWGFKVRIQYIAWGEETTTLQTRIAGGGYHAVSIGPWSNYLNNAQNGYFKDLTPFLSEVPALADAFGGEDELLKLSIDGRGLCYIPQKALAGGGNGVYYRKDLLKDFGVGEITDIASLTNYLEAASESYNRPMVYFPDVTDYILTMFTDLVSDAGGGLGHSVVASTRNDPYTAINVYETEAFKQTVEVAVDWYEKGLISPDVMNSSALPDVGQELIAGTLPVHVGNHYASGKTNFIPQAMTSLNQNADSNVNNIEWGFMFYETGEYAPTDANLANTTGWALNANIKDEEAAALMKFIEAAHTDIEFYDIYQYGQQGINYENFSEDEYGRYVSYGDLASEVRMYRKLATGLTNEYLMRKEEFKYDELAVFFNEIDIDRQSKVVANPLNGFVFEKEAVENEIMAVTSVQADYASLRAGLLGGKSIDDAIAELNTKLYDAGLQRIIDEVNRQLEEFKSAI